MLDALDLRQHLLGGAGHQVFDLGRRGPGEGDEDIGEGDVDLGLFLPRRHQHREHPQQQPDQGQQGGDLGGLEARGDAARDQAEGLSHGAPPRRRHGAAGAWDFSSTPAAIGSRATAFALGQTGQHHEGVVQGAAQPDLAEVDMPLRQHHIDPGDLRAVDHGRLGDRQFRLLTHHEAGLDEHPREERAGLARRQVHPHLEGVGLQIGEGEDGDRPRLSDLPSGR